MAWTAPRTWVSGETLTAALMNTHVRDNLLETSAAKVTTAGDITYATGANALSRLGIGSAGALLVVGSSAPRWSSTGVTAAAGSAVNVRTYGTLTAAANSDTLYNIFVDPTFAKSTFTGLTAIGVAIPGGGWSSSGSGAIANCYGLYITAPTIGTANWSIYVSDGNVRLGGTSSKVFIGDTSNADMTSGLTINQGSATDDSVTLKSSAVAHGFTSLAETDTYLGIRPIGSGGGLALRTFSSSGSGEANYGLGLVNYAASANSTTKSNTSGAAVGIVGAGKSGTSSANLGANENILAVVNNGTVRFILDGDGDSHQDVGTAWTNFDTFDDAALLNLLSAHVTKPDDPLRAGFAKWLEQDRAPLEAARIVTFNPDGHHFINWSRASMLLIGAVRQMADRIQALAGELADNRAMLATFETRLIEKG